MFTKRKFELTDEQYNEIKMWDKAHECSIRRKEKRSKSCCGGELTISFTPTTIGTVITVKCICGEEYIIDDL